MGGAHAVTDVTGFGLCGHGFEMAEGSGVTLAIDLALLPIIPGIEKHGLTRLRPRASRSNADYVRPFSRFEGTPDPVRVEFLADPQTSGGLLISLERDRAATLVEELRRNGAPFAGVIGEVLAKQDAALIFRS